MEIVKNKHVGFYELVEMARNGEFLENGVYAAKKLKSNRGTTVYIRERSIQLKTNKNGDIYMYTDPKEEYFVVVDGVETYDEDTPIPESLVIYADLNNGEYVTKIEKEKSVLEIKESTEDGVKLLSVSIMIEGKPHSAWAQGVGMYKGSVDVEVSANEG